MYVPVPVQIAFNWSLFPRPLGLLATGCFLLALANTARGMGVVTCKMSPKTVAAGETVTATFDFPYDVSQRRVVAVIVDRFSLNESDPTEPERVFECLKQDTPNLSCGTRSEGYNLEGEVKSSLTLRITDVSPQHSGRFIYYVMSPEKEIPETEPCSLLVRDVLDVSATTTTEPAEPAVTMELLQDVLDVSATTTTEPAKPAVTTDLGGQGSDRNHRETTTSWMIPVIVISVMLPLIIFVSIFAIFRRRKSRRADEKNDEDDEGEEKTDGGRGDGEGGAGKDDKDKDAGEENEDKQPFLDAVIIG